MFRKQPGLPKPATSPRLYRRKRHLSDAAPSGLPTQRRLLRLALRSTALFVLGLLSFLIFLRWNPRAKQAVEDLIRYTTDDLGIRSDRRKSLHLSKDVLTKLFAYEVSAGHYPFASLPSKQISKALFRLGIVNPATRAPRTYTTLSLAQRAPAGATLDLEQVMANCAFENGKYVVDCLKLLSGKDGSADLLYTSGATADPFQSFPPTTPFLDLVELLQKPDSDPGSLYKSAFPIEYTDDWLPGCLDEEQPKLFHVFWTGPFTDKPYTTALSFLATQRLSLHDPSKRASCPPRLIFWLVPSSAYSSVDPPANAHETMLGGLQRNRWAAPLLADRFKPFLSFHLFNATEQLDATPELAEHWREVMLQAQEPESVLNEETTATSSAAPPSVEQYDRLAVIMSDMARFLLCHRFGGIYLDADTLLLRDFEELFNWPGAFAYRWSRMREYNSAVLKMNRGSALGSFILRTALLNWSESAFHPHSVWQYLSKTKPGLEKLLLRLPDAMFDPAWLNTEYFQRDRPPSPYFKSFDDFFKRPDRSPASKGTASEGFFAGAYAYHYHNNWWTPFDPARDFPDMAPREVVPGAVEETPRWSWAAALKREWEGFLRGQLPNMYGEVLAGS